ncbi:LysR family transcriptional regulator [Streptomyces boluensis]|uniref:LysR family transcriptional regulator n=1 Tax=Streptomyces boluensis TaxID=1775135 RepID=A0A964URS1_9ACTN|nr:LysR family transcriptional regulator [Streptomyces boluensis]NBE53240.1 LysR family transcriptional regulator [Streptomyces boluensis]
MDLVGACRAFVSVTEYGSFTVGAAAARMSQPVASRRVAALEEHFGERLFERTGRRAVLTPFGRAMLPAARRLVQAAEVLAHEAKAARHRPWRLAVPGSVPPARLARLVAEARGHDITLDLRVAGPAERMDLLHAQQVRAALVAVPERDATWSVPLGVATADDPGVRRVYLETLRLGRTGGSRARRVWVQPEDDVPHVRDPLARLRDALGLRPAQLAVGADLTTAAAEVLCTLDLLVCSPAQAEELGLCWRPLGEAALVRGYALTAAADDDPRQLTARLGAAVARCLGADPWQPDRSPTPGGPTTGEATETTETTEATQATADGVRT